MILALGIRNYWQVTNDRATGGGEQAMEAKGYKGIGMEGPIAKWYAKIAHKDIEEFKALRSRSRRHQAYCDLLR